MAGEDQANLLRLTGDASSLRDASQQGAAALRQVEQSAAALDAKLNALAARAEATGNRMRTMAQRARASAGEIDLATGLPKASAAAPPDPNRLGTTSSRAGGPIVTRGGGIDPATGLRRTQEAAEGLARSQERARGSATALAQSLALISPEASLAARAIKDLQDGMAFLMTPAGLHMAAWVAGIAAIGLAIKAVTDEAAKANKEFKDFLEAQQRIRDAARERQEEVNQAAIQRGLPQVAADKARGLADFLTGLGIDRSAAVEAAVSGVDEQGNQVVDNQQLVELAVGRQAGIVDQPFEGTTERRRAQSRRRDLRDVERNREAIQNALSTVLGERERQLDDLAGGRAGAAEIRSRLQQEGLEGEALEERTAKVLRHLQSPPPKPEVISTEYGERIIGEDIDPLAVQIKQESAQAVRAREKFHAAAAGVRSPASDSAAPPSGGTVITGGTHYWNAGKSEPARRMEAF